MSVELIGGFSPREAARDVYSAVQAIPRGRVIGRSLEDTNASRVAAYKVAQLRIDQARGTPRLLSGEPDDDQLEAMAAAVAAELARLDANP